MLFARLDNACSIGNYRDNPLPCIHVSQYKVIITKCLDGTRVSLGCESFGREGIGVIMAIYSVDEYYFMLRNVQVK